MTLTIGKNAFPMAPGSFKKQLKISQTGYDLVAIQGDDDNVMYILVSKHDLVLPHVGMHSMH